MVTSDQMITMAIAMLKKAGIKPSKHEQASQLPFIVWILPEELFRYSALHIAEQRLTQIVEHFSKEGEHDLIATCMVHRRKPHELAKQKELIVEAFIKPRKSNENSN